ncbi:Co2+/Mg2+ efflux protein ApaG [Humitalea sp. 24SJ18S-53]|uniref:Co2+/Mg2+ efflux protein ApaG n=1 Tax=Humitalea sp. 24SJ18S-53 TaxID=3422307 RepID=UPI003D67BF99
MADFTATTEGVRITVSPVFLDERSDPDEGQWVWAYHVVIENVSERTVQLRRRTWLITDALGRTLRVEGEGVVGEQPVLAPGGRFEYTSGTPLPTSSGFMRGSYRMKDMASGEAFDAQVPPFSLDSPFSGGAVH